MTTRKVSCEGEKPQELAGDDEGVTKSDQKSGSNEGKNHSNSKLPLVFSTALREHPPPVPPQLLRKLACKDSSGSLGKVRKLIFV